MAVEVLNALEGGIDRQRVKGSPSPKVLYDLVNGYVDRAGRVQSRDGVEVDAVLPEGTIGLVAFQGAMAVFSHQAVADMPAGYTCYVLSHPDNPALAIHRIHFAAPFMGALYVAAEFAGGDTYHYWLPLADTWEAETIYGLGDLVQPTVPNGLAYKCTRLLPPYPEWAPDVERTVGDRVEPTEHNDYFYEVVATGAGQGGDNPIGGSGGTNRSFETTDFTGWTPDAVTIAGWSVVADAEAPDGEYVAEYDPVAGGANTSTLDSSEQFAVAPGQTANVTIKCRVPAGCTATGRLSFYRSNDTLISSSSAGTVFPTGGTWELLSSNNPATAPAETAYCVPGVQANSDGAGVLAFDYLSVVVADP